LTLAEVIKDNAKPSEVSVQENLKQVTGMDETKITIKLAFQKAARWQVIATLSVSLALLPLTSVHAAVSCALGGMVAVIGGYAGVLMTRRRVDQSAGGMLIALLKAEITKVMAISVQLLAIFKFYDGLVPLALIGGLAVSVLVSGAGLGAVGNNK